ncbi:hypothetical protein [Ureibacillus xyleni]|nr:hypothetical protein [Ureibacillus xyleni]
MKSRFIKYEPGKEQKNEKTLMKLKNLANHPDNSIELQTSEQLTKEEALFWVKEFDIYQAKL